MSISSLARASRFFVLAFALPLVALGIKVFLDAFIGHAVPFLLFFAGVIAAAWRGGRNCGILASVWSGALAALFFLSSASEDGVAKWVQVAFFIAEGIFISIVIAHCRAVQDSLAKRAQRQGALAQISEVALNQASNLDHIYQRAGEICAQTLGVSRVAVERLDNLTSTEPNENSFFEAVTARQEPVEIGDLAQSPLQLPPKWRGQARAALGVPIGDKENPFGVLLALDDNPNAWQDDECGFLCAVAGILAVVVQRSRAQELQRKDEARYRAFVEQSSEAIWCCEFTPPLDLGQSEDEFIDAAYERGDLTECNDAFAQMYGYERAEELLGARLGDLLVREDPRNIEYLRAFLRSEYRLTDAQSIETDREGRIREFSNNLIGIIENGKLPRVWGTQRDISVQQEATAQLRSSEARFRVLFDAAPVAIAITRDGILLYVNQASVKLLGCQSSDEMIGHPVSEFVAPPDRDTMQKRIERRAAGFDEPLVYETTSLRRDGVMRPFRIEIGQLELPDGAATLAFAFDLTEEKAAQAQRQQLWEKERRSAERAARLQAITAALAATTTLTRDEVGQLIITQGVEALGAKSGALSIPGHDENGDHLRIIASVGYSKEILSQYGRLPMDASLPAVRAFIKNQPFWIGTRQEAIDAHPIFATVLPQTGTQALSALPLEVEGRKLGVLSLSFNTSQTFDTETRAFMLTLAGQCAQALDRVRLFNEARDAARMQEESLALLNTLLASAPVGIAFYDLKGRHVLVNDALCRIDGCSVEDHLGKTPTEVFPAIDGTLEAVIARVIEEGVPISEMEHSGVARADSDEIRHHLLSFYPVRVGAGEISGVGAMILDITARTRDERERVQLMGELEIERARFEAILQQMPSAVVIGEAPSGRTILGNSQVEAALGRPYTPSRDVAEYSQFHGFHPDGRELEPHEWPLARAIQNGEIVRGEQIIIARGDDSMGIVRMNAAPIRDRDGQITAGIVIFDDVTQSARADNAQRFLAEAGSALVSTLDEKQTYERLAKLCVPRIADWCIVVVPAGSSKVAQVAVANADPDQFGAAQAFKNQLEQGAGSTWSDALRGKKGALYSGDSIEDLRELDASGKTTEFMKAIGAVSIIVSPLGAGERVLGAMIWVTAESDRSYDRADLELADELARRAGLTADSARLYRESQFARDEAQNANRAKDEFLAVVSHELRTPLTPILGWIELLRTPGANQEMRDQAYNVIERNARAQAQLVNDILDVSRITTGKLRLELKPVDLSLLVEFAVESLRSNAKEKKISLELAIEEVGQTIADSNRMQQVVWNLLQNAIKFTPEQGHIRVSLDKRDDTAFLQVSDSGTGIHPDFLPYVFDRFRQADSSSTRKAGGLGLGLAIVSHIVEGHRGRAFAHSEGVGKGATFTIELPLIPVPKAAEVSPPPPKRAPKRTEPGALEGLNIVVTDDEPDTREMMRVLLKSHGAIVQSAGSAQETLEMMKDGATDLLISDIGMPLVDGYELRSELALRGFEKPSIALTAYTAQSDAKKAIEAGFNAHLPKPVDHETLLKLIVTLARPTAGAGK